MIQLSGLLDIEVIPLEFETVVTPASVEVISHTKGKFEIHKEGGDFTPVKKEMQTDVSDFSRSARIQAYNFAKRTENVPKGKKHNIHRTDLSYDGPSLANSTSNHSLAENKPMKKLAFEYNPEQINFNWIRDERVLKFTPGSVEFQITQYPEVLIDYLGGPMYCPPSSAPDYVPPEMNMVV